MSGYGNVRIARNAISLTAMMLVTLAVGVFTSRIVLQQLGIDDFGIYSLVVSLIGIISFCLDSMQTCVTRYMSVAMAKPDTDAMASVFASATRATRIAMLFVLALGVIAGIPVVVFVFNIPPGSLTSTLAVYACSVAGMLFTIARVPFQGYLLGAERMGRYAVIETLQSLLKLGAVALLIVIPGNHLIIYALLVMGVNIAVYLCYSIEYKMLSGAASPLPKVRADNTTVRKMLSFSTLDIASNIGARAEWIAILINVYFGVVVNTALSLALTVTRAMTSLSISVNRAFVPRITKLFAIGDIRHMQKAMTRAMALTMASMGIMAIPFLVFTPWLINLWLGSEPPHLVVFLRLMLVSMLISLPSNTTIVAVQATGNLRISTTYTATIMALVPLLSWLAFALGANVLYTFYISIGINILYTFGIIAITRWQIGKQFKPLRYTIAILGVWSAITIATLAIFYLTQSLKFGN